MNINRAQCQYKNLNYSMAFAHRNSIAQQRHYRHSKQIKNRMFAWLRSNRSVFAVVCVRADLLGHL